MKRASPRPLSQDERGAPFHASPVRDNSGRGRARDGEPHCQVHNGPCVFLELSLACTRNGRSATGVLQPSRRHDKSLCGIEERIGIERLCQGGAALREVVEVLHLAQSCRKPTVDRIHERPKTVRNP